jgi:hypothetical protein
MTTPLTTPLAHDRLIGRRRQVHPVQSYASSLRNESFAATRVRIPTGCVPLAGRATSGL